MIEISTELHYGDCKEKLKLLKDNSIDLVVTSPPYADSRINTYGGISPDKYVEWFLPISKELLRVLKPAGTFILNIKEKVVDGERHAYVIELILNMRKQGWFWTEEFIWHKKIVSQGNGQIGSGTHGKGFFNLTRTRSSICTKKKLWCRWVIGRNLD